jgi:RNA polymerase sigma factor (sigma-70 family)
MAELTDLVNSARLGDPAAFAQIVERFQDMAYACAAAYLGDAHLAQDAAQEAFVTAYVDLRAGKLNDPAAFPGWLKTIVRRQCSRMSRGNHAPTVRLDATTLKTATAPDAERTVNRLAAEAAAMAALQSLPESYRLVTVLFYFSGYSNEQIAEFLGVPLTTVKKRLHDARRKLQEWVVNAMSENLQSNSPSRDPRFAEKVKHLIQPEELKKAEPLVWSPGIGTEVWELFCAAASGELTRIKRLLDKDPALVRANYIYRTPIYFAVRENQVEAAAMLLERGADPLSLAYHDTLLEVARDRGYAGMQKLLEGHLAKAHGASAAGETVPAAIRERDLAKVRSLLDAAPELLRAADARGNQPIHWAAMTRQPSMIDELLARGADIDAKRADGARPIQLNNGDYFYRGGRDVPKETTTTPAEVMAHLRSRGAYVDICTAAHFGDLNRVRELLDEDPTLANRVSGSRSYYACSGAPLRNAAGAGHMEIVKLLLERGAEPNLPEEHIAPQGFALHASVTNGHHDIARLLLEHGAHANAKVESSGDCLSRALGNKDQKMVELLASYGAAQSLDILAYYGDVRTAAAMFAIDPTLADDPEALAYAAEEGQEPFVRLMLRCQPDLARRIEWHSWESAGKTRELNELLFKHGMDPNQTDWLRITPLHRFAKNGAVYKAEVFLDHGANLDARDDDICSTPLAWAAKFGRKAVVEFLLKRGAKTNLPDDPPWATPLAWATRRGHNEIAELLKQHGAI